MLQKFQTLIEKYDNLILDLDVKELSDEDIDTILGSESEMLESIKQIIIAKKIYANRRLTAEKEEKKCDALTSRIMRRLEIDNFETEDGNVKKTIQRTFETDLKKLSNDYKMASRSKIHSAITKNIKIK
jgi:hypothetical protein